MKRAVSAHQHQVRLGNENLPFIQSLPQETARINAAKAATGRWWRHAYVEVGFYGAQIAVAQKILGKDRILVLRQDDLRDIAALESRLSTFLSLTAPFAPNLAVHSNPAVMPRSRLFNHVLTRDNPLKRLVRRLLPREFRTGIAVKIMQLNGKKVARAEIDADNAAKLTEMFRADQELLAKLGYRSHDAG